MSIRTDAASARRSSVTKAVASLGVLAAAAAVAGLGSFGAFTDSTTPVQADVDTGVLSINLTVWVLVGLDGDPAYFWPMWLAVPGVALFGATVGVESIRRTRRQDRREMP